MEGECLGIRLSLPGPQATFSSLLVPRTHSAKILHLQVSVLLDCLGKGLRLPSP